MYKNMKNKERHEAKIELQLACYNPDDPDYMSSEFLKNDFLEKHPDLKIGDTVQYTIDKNTDDIVVFGKVETSKTIIPIKN